MSARKGGLGGGISRGGIQGIHILSCPGKRGAVILDAL